MIGEPMGRAEDWLREAEEDLESAGILLEGGSTTMPASTPSRP